jgi:hypothetical protein
MGIIGCDLHARQQTLAMLETTTGEVVNLTLMHDGNEVREFYSQLPHPVLVGIEATGSYLCGLVSVLVTITRSRRLSTKYTPGRLAAISCMRCTAASSPSTLSNHRALFSQEPKKMSNSGTVAKTRAT